VDHQHPSTSFLHEPGQLLRAAQIAAGLASYLITPRDGEFRIGNIGIFGCRYCISSTRSASMVAVFHRRGLLAHVVLRTVSGPYGRREWYEGDTC
jgi:hypothetical protein